jgi:cell division protein FtsB
METGNQPPHAGTRTDSEFAVNYNQSDVDNIRDQIEQTESAKRRWLFLVLVVTIAALVGAIVLLSTNYALHSSSESDKKKLIQENAALKSRADQTQQQLDSKNLQETKDATARADSQTKLQTILPAILRGSAGPGEITSFARWYIAPQRSNRVGVKAAGQVISKWKVSVGGTKYCA